MRGMRRAALIFGVILLVGAIFAAIIPMWVMSSGMGITRAGWGAVILMIVFCFGVGGGLMFLIFFSARQGYDQAAYQSTAPSREDADALDRKELDERLEEEDHERERTL